MKATVTGILHVCVQTGGKVGVTGSRSATGQTKVSLCVRTHLIATLVVTIRPTAAQTAAIGLRCDGGNMAEWVELSRCLRKRKGEIFYHFT